MRRTAISFVELDRDLTHRFPKLSLPDMPLYSLEGGAVLKKGHKKDKAGHRKRSDVSLAVDELMMLQPRLTEYVSSLMAIEPVLNCEEMRTFLTELSSAIRDEDDGHGDDSKHGRSVHEQKIRLIIERFGKGKNADGSEGLESMEQLLLEGVPVTKHKVQPSQIHSVTLNVEEAGHVLVWGFTTLPGKSTPAKVMILLNGVGRNGHDDDRLGTGDDDTRYRIY